MSHVFPRHSTSDLPTAVAGEGCYLIDANGKRYFDGSGGAAVSCLGHSDAAVIEAVKAQVETLAFAHTGFMTSQLSRGFGGSVDLQRARHAGPGLFCLRRVGGHGGGDQACPPVSSRTGEPQRRHLIARRQSYHGNTLGALAAGAMRGDDSNLIRC